jgi:predicted DNA-binding protein with PD1-like motif
MKLLSIAKGVFFTVGTISALALAPRPAGARLKAAVTWLRPAETGPHGQAPGAQSRILATTPDGTTFHVLILKDGDEVLTGLADFAVAQRVVAAHFSGIGAVRDAEVGWFDLRRKQYKGMSLPEQLEVMSLAGDIALGPDGKPVVHAHMALARDNGDAWGGHLLRATTSPTMEIFLTTYPTPLQKVEDAQTGLLLIHPELGRK